MDPSKWMTHDKAKLLIKKLGPAAAKVYLRRYFKNLQLPTDPAIRRLEFARFFFHDAFNEESPEFHVEIFREYSNGINFGLAAPRGHAKTTVSSVEVIYRLVNELNRYTLVISDTYSQARDIVDNIRGELEANPMILWVYGDLSTQWHWTSGSFTTSNNVRVTARGSNMKVRGLKFRHWRPDFAVTDDIENDEAVVKSERREKLLKWFKMALLPAMARKQSQVAVVGTVLHADSLLNNLIHGQQGFAGWSRRKFSALNLGDNGEEWSLWPTMFSAVDLKRMRDDPTYEKYLGPLAFAQEMQNDPVDDSSRVIKREWIYGTEERPNTYSLTAKEHQWASEHPENAKNWVQSYFKQIIMAVDPAISEKTTADYFAIVVIGIDHQGEIWILDIFQDRIGDIDVQVAKVLEFVDQWKPDRVKVEAVAYQAGLARQIQRTAAERGKYAPVFKVTPDKDKFRRAVIHSANFAGNLVHIRTDHPFSEAFIMQLLDFPVGKNDDMFDAYMHAAEDTTMRYQTRTFKSKPKGF